MSPGDPSSIEPGSASTPLPAHEPHSRLHGAFVRVMIAVTVLLFIAMIALLYYRWITVVEPSSVLSVRGDERLAGAVVRVQGVGLTEPHEVTLDQTGGYSARFFLEPGSYTVIVTLPNDEPEELYRQDFVLFERTALRLELSDLPVPDAAQPQ